MKKLITVLLASMLGILSVESALAEELSSGNETDVILDETATPESVSEILAEEASPQIEASAINDTYEIPQITPEDVLSAGETEETVLESGGETPVSGETYSGTWGTCNWDIDSEGVLTIHAGTGADNQEKWSVWYEYDNIIYSVVAEKGVLFPQKSSYLFSYLHHCESIDLSQVDSSAVTDMSHMFYDCQSLTSLDISNFDTSNVRDMAYMFYNFELLTNLNVNSFDTSNVMNMQGMFYMCESLTNLDLSNFNTSNVTVMKSMFYCCNSMINLNLSSFNTSNVTNMNDMFSYCNSLTDLDLSSFSTYNVTEMSSMFSVCKSLISLDLSSFDTCNVTDMHSMFYGCESLTNVDLSSFDTSNVMSMYNMFSYCSSLINLDLSNFDTSKVTNMSDMFFDCSSLTSLDVSNFDTSNVTEMTNMFCDCNSLINLDVSNFDTSNVKSIGYMFSGCESLISLDLSNFDTSNVTYDRRKNYLGTISMLYGCINLSQLKTGSKFCFRGDGGCPSYYSDLPNLPSLPDRFWRSESTGNIYTTNELTGTRNNIADTYYAYNFPHPRLVAAYNGVEGIGLKFQKVENAKKYLLYRKYNGTWSHICTFKPDDPSLQIDGNKIMYTDISVAKNYGKGYIYSVSAIVGDLETTYDTKGAAIYRLTPPTLTAAANSSAGTATITWKGVFGKTETNGTYDLQYAEYKDGKAGTFKSMTALPGYNNQTSSATVKGLKKGSRYVFRIRCAKTNKDRGTYYSEYSPWLSVTIEK